jgi:HSP20 family molecular chaperone IbpA
MNCSENTSTLTRKPHFTSQREPDAIQLKVELPGVSKEGVNLDFVDDVLTITGTYQNQAPAQWTTVCNYESRLRSRVAASLPH